MTVSGAVLLNPDDDIRPTFNFVSLRASKIGNDVNATNIHLKGKLWLDEALGGSLLLTAATLTDIDVSRAKIADNLLAAATTINGAFDAFDLAVGGSVVLSSLADTRGTFDAINLRGAKVGHYLNARTPRSGASLTFPTQRSRKAYTCHVAPSMRWMRESRLAHRWWGEHPKNALHSAS